MTKKRLRRKPFILGIIPARGDSKGIKRKNLKKICGKPLIYWSIMAAQKSKLIDRFIVSTEDKEIKNVAKRFGADVLDRPPSLARDHSTTISLLQHILNHDIEADIVVLLQPTSPIRDGRLIDKCIKTFLDKEADVLATGFRTYQYEWGRKRNTPRQKLKGWFYDDGNVYVFRATNIKKGIWVGGKKWQMIVRKIYNFEIDDETDFLIVEMLMRKFLSQNMKKK